MNSLTSRSRPISQFLTTPTKTLYISLFSTSSSSSSPSQHHGYSSSYRRDEESRNVRVSVWWDIENCGVPNGVNVFKIAHSITAAVRTNGIKGPVQITAFGDIFCISRSNQEALSSTGVNLIHIPNGGKNSADRSLLVDLMCWVSQNPPPAHIFLISGDRDFAGILHKLRMSNYNILLAARDAKQTPGVLYSAASIMWHWNELAKGENLLGMHFNQPPDGPFNSWYGHYRGPLEDPFAVSEQQRSPETADSSNAEESSDCKHRPIPLAILRQLRRIINSHPEGLTITELRDQLAKDNVSIDKGFYGHKKFSRFLLALPRIVDVESRADGQFFLRPAQKLYRKSVQREDNSVQSMAVNGSRDAQMAEKAIVEPHTITRMADVEPSLSKTDSVDGKEETEKKQVGREILEEKVLGSPSSQDEVAPTEHPNGKEILDVQLVESLTTPTKEHHSKSQNGLFRKLWAKLFGRNIGAETMRDSAFERLNTSNVSPDKLISEEKQSKSTNQNDVLGQAESSPGVTFSTCAKGDTVDDSEVSPGFMAKLKSWFKFGRTGTAVDKPVDQLSEGPCSVEENSKQLDGVPDSEQLDDDISQSKKLDDKVPPSRRHELFAKESFWCAIRSFLRTNRGSGVISNSISREQFAERLEKEGPLILRTLQTSDIHQLVDLLVSEKKWIEELPTRSPLFKLAYSFEESSAVAQPRNSNGLSSIFLSSPSHENPQLRVSTIGHKRPFEKSRSEILADCQKLLDEILPQHPEGFNISYFKKHFLDKYGYALDHQKLGYPKMVSLLQIMPGVKVESTHVFRDNVVYAPGIESLGSKDKSRSSNNEMSDSAQKDEDVESPWEELGPVSNSNQEKKEAKTCQHEGNDDYELSLSSDDELSDNENSSSPAARMVKQNRSTVNEDDSSLLQILDSWYSTNKESRPKDPSSSPEESTDDSEDDYKPSGSSNAVVGEAFAAATSANNGRKKIYSFVAESPVTQKDKLINGILGSLKKSGESRVHG